MLNSSRKLLLGIIFFLILLIGFEIYIYSSLRDTRKPIYIAATPILKKNDIDTLALKILDYSKMTNTDVDFFTTFIYRGNIRNIQINNEYIDLLIEDKKNQSLKEYQKFPLSLMRRTNNNTSNIKDLRKGMLIEIREFETVEIVGKKNQLFVEIKTLQE